MTPSSNWEKNLKGSVICLPGLQPVQLRGGRPSWKLQDGLNQAEIRNDRDDVSIVTPYSFREDRPTARVEDFRY